MQGVKCFLELLIVLVTMVSVVEACGQLRMSSGTNFQENHPIMKSRLQQNALKKKYLSSKGTINESFLQEKSNAEGSVVPVAVARYDLSTQPFLTPL